MMNMRQYKKNHSFIRDERDELIQEDVGRNLHHQFNEEKKRSKIN